MNTPQDRNLFKLPLSWARTDSTTPTFNTVKVPFTSAQWIPTAEVPQGTSFDELYESHLQSMTKGVVLQSVNVELRDYLLQKGWQAAALGIEAILDLPWRGKRSVRELARRGRRHGTVQEVENSQHNQAKLSALIDSSPSRQGVQLKFTERPDFDDSTRLLVFETAEQQWLGGVTISTNSTRSAHTELLVRHQNAPVGIMEALISAIAQQLTNEGFTQLSLGNVPPMPTAENKALFAKHRHPNELWFRSKFMFSLGGYLNFAFNAKGLWQFKNKFSPRWEPLYLVSSRRISWLMVIGLLQATGFPKLVQSKLTRQWLPSRVVEQERPMDSKLVLTRT